MALPNPEYAKRLFSEINNQLRNDCLYYEAQSLEMRLKKIPEEKEADVDSKKRILLERKEKMYSNHGIHIEDREELRSYLDEKIRSSSTIEKIVLMQHNIEARKGRSQEVSYFCEAVRFYNTSVEEERKNQRIREEKCILEEEVERMKSKIGYSYEPVLGRIGIDIHSQIPENAAEDFEKLDKDAQLNIISIFLRFMIADKFPKELIRYPSNKDYEAIRSYFTDFAKRINK